VRLRMGNKSCPSYDMSNKTVIVTGANSGIGKATSLLIAKSGAHVVMACRSKERGKAALDEIKTVVPEAKLELMSVDLGDFDSIVNFCAEYKKTHNTLDVLVNNAGVVLAKWQKSKYELEEMFTVNHLGTALMTMSFLDILEKNNGRIVTVASNAHVFSSELTKERLMGHPFTQEEIGTEPGAMTTMKQYGFTKLCNILFTNELNKELRNRKSTVSVFAVHPGWVESGLGGDGKGFFMKTIESIVAKTPEEGSYPSFFCACDPSLTIKDSGGYYDGISSLGSLKDYAQDEAAAKILWDYTMQTLGPYLPK